MHKRLKVWFLSERRDLPWRQNPSPYTVWVSEMMLQQTQVAVVIPYFLRWMDRFPTIQSLAEADLDEVIKLWEGLGYYSRARRLHEGARQVLSEFGGRIPNNGMDLDRIKGLGPYTIGAILSFAFHQKATAVDGNVVRVLSRYFLIEEDVSKPSTMKRLREIAESALPDEEPWIFNEALIELGATICTRKPKCGSCPLKSSCQGYQQGKADSLPSKPTRSKIEILHRAVAVVYFKEHFLVRRVPKGMIMDGLHEFPYIETGSEGISHKQFAQHLQNEWKLKLNMEKELPSATHAFTRYKAYLSPVQFKAEATQQIDQCSWIERSKLKGIAFSSGHRRILESLI